MSFRKKHRRTYRDPPHTASITIRITPEQKNKLRETGNIAACVRGLIDRYLMEGEQ